MLKRSTKSADKVRQRNQLMKWYKYIVVEF
nr:MAG TPA: hypothetical protein [Caudoviricetes sp.]